MSHPSLHARTMPDKPAYVMADTGEALSFGTLDARSNQGAHLFRALGLAAGDHIALLLENSLVFMEIAWAAQRSGIYYTALSRYLKEDEITYIVRDCGARVVITSAACAAPLHSLVGVADGPRLYMVGTTAPGYESWEAARDAMPATPIPDEVAGRDMLYSSGTTGRPKGVAPALTGQAITELSPLIRLLCVDMCGIGPGSVYLSPAPLYHAAPLRFSMTVAALGGTCVIMSKFDAETFLRYIEQYRVTQTQVVPTMFVRLLKLPEEARHRYDISSLSGVIHAAAPCPPDVKAAMIDWWGPILIEYYAGTEANGATLITSREWLAHRGSVGRAIVGVLKIVGEDGEEVQPGETGLVYFADGPRFVYHNDPAKTAGAYNDRGWSTLGDVGHVDEEGYLYLTDRRAYMIISGGVNVYPQETEDVLIGHPEVADVAVFGVPDEEMGEAVKAVVQPADTARAGPALEAALIAYARERLSAIKCPRSIDFLPELPRTPTGKLLKRLLRDQYWPKKTERGAG
ncbi:acyl-CoA synthetase [Acidisphaera rubrifaciens]|uniref:Long chain fatty acid--CoA ligase n=1 Tax=Acidisphaera rubrifaciens HS-AP3 TaxID=1231350 RepID=A0A0D6PAA5_9PROT|nr:acyl-CoA synthetase [Acidisphaera rubrifaciens]GAN78296.1 long chain fatty acid--CoA ligase [Acidisphaera rubrifaciens HS-AP3]